MKRIFVAAVIVAVLPVLAAAQAVAGAGQGLMPADLLKVRSVGETKFSPDGNMIAYTISNNDGPNRPYSQLYVMDVRNGHTTRFSEGQEGSGNPEWSPDGQWIAYSGSLNGKQ